MALNFEKMGYWGSDLPHKPTELAFITQVPPLVDINPRDAKVVARSFERLTILQSATPDRDQVRRENYGRRKKQMDGEGFVSLIQKPYKAVGAPVYLDNKSLIVEALSLPNQKSEETGSLVDGATHDQDTAQQQTPQPYMLRRSRKQLNTLKKETERGRNLLKSVRLGHSLFKILQEEWQSTLHKKEREIMEAKERINCSWQVADVDEDYDAEETAVEDQGLEKYQVAPETGERVHFAVRPDTHSGPEERMPMATMRRLASAPPSSGRKSYNSNCRPYTPVHSNINQKEKPTGNALFKQLCALHWILKAMDIPDSSIMTPIIQCWEMHCDRMGGEELFNRKQIEERLAKEQNRYDNFVRKSRKVDATLFRKQSRVHDRKKQPAAMPSMTRGVSVAGSRSRTNSVTQTTEISPPDHPVRETEDTKVLPTGSEQQLKQSTVGQPVSTQPKSAPSWQPTKEELQQIELSKQLEEAAKADSAPIERLSSKLYRATGIIKSKTSPELIEFKKNSRSSQLTNRPLEIRQHWADVKEEHALKLHDDLDHQEKNRLRNCQNKFSAMTTSGSSLYRALKTMRLHSEHMWRETEKEKNKKQDQSRYAKWYDALVNSVPADAEKTWFFTRIMDKLRIYGIKYGPDEKTESSSKASEHKFAKVMKLLRPWELCAPDIAAAVEFCREYIIEMNEQDFEELLQCTFPAIRRPATAPPKKSQKH